jgi:hypothetical protein
MRDGWTRVHPGLAEKKEPIVKPQGPQRRAAQTSVSLSAFGSRGAMGAATGVIGHPVPVSTLAMRRKTP